jgi:7-cyano-7-deazaguanine synthase
MPETAVLFSGGLDSAVLVAAEARHAPVHPLYVSTGLAWEPAERAVAARLLASPPFDARVRPLVALEFTVRDLYAPTHWAIRGVPPAYDTPDEDVYLVGRNLVLLAKAGIYCAQHGVTRLALGPLAGNPFPDARPRFFEAMAEALSLGLDRPIEIATPLREMHKDQVIALGVALGVPLEFTLSCMNPVGDAHCGACSKCRERRDAFAAAGVSDPTAYRAEAPTEPPG